LDYGDILGPALLLLLGGPLDPDYRPGEHRRFGWILEAEQVGD